MPEPARTALTVLLIFAAAVWVGGFVAIVVVARVASRTLPAAARVSFFRALGRAYGVVGGLALVLGLGTGAALLYGHVWTPTMVATAVDAALLVAATAIGIAQARRMTRLRRRAVADPSSGTLAEQVRRGARRAALLRALIGLLSLALLALGVLVAA